MPTDVIMPALGMAQATGRVIAWRKTEGELVVKGEPLFEVETDKLTTEIEAPASGVLTWVRAGAGDDVPVGDVIACILAPAEIAETTGDPLPPALAALAAAEAEPAPQPAASQISATPVAQRIAAEHGVDLRAVRPDGGRVVKDDVLNYLQRARTRLEPASPKARRLAAERGIALEALRGSGPAGAVLAADVLGFQPPAPVAHQAAPEAAPQPGAEHGAEPDAEVSAAWRVMVERLSQSWTTVPHFYLVRDVAAAGLQGWQREARARSTHRPTLSDALVLLVAAALREHPQLNGGWADGRLVRNRRINIGLAVAAEEGLLVPVIHDADQLRLGQIAERRADLVARTQQRRLRPDDLRDGTFTISNLGMFGVDAFSAIVNPPQAAILAVGRIGERVVPVDGQPAVRPMLSLTLSCDHRAVDGARAARFLDSLAALIAQPLRALD